MEDTRRLLMLGLMIIWLQRISADACRSTLTRKQPANSSLFSAEFFPEGQAELRFVCNFAHGVNGGSQEWVVNKCRDGAWTYTRGTIPDCRRKKSCTGTFHFPAADRCYFWSVVPTWTEARRFCDRYGAEVLIFDDRAHMAAVKEAMNVDTGFKGYTSTKHHSLIWYGLSRDSGTGEFAPVRPVRDPSWTPPWKQHYPLPGGNVDPRKFVTLQFPQFKLLNPNKHELRKAKEFIFAVCERVLDDYWYRDFEGPDRVMILETREQLLLSIKGAAWSALLLEDFWYRLRHRKTAETMFWGSDSVREWKYGDDETRTSAWKAAWGVWASNRTRSGPREWTQLAALPLNEIHEARNGLVQQGRVCGKYLNVSSSPISRPVVYMPHGLASPPLYAGELTLDAPARYCWQTPHRTLNLELSYTAKPGDTGSWLLVDTVLTLYDVIHVYVIKKDGWSNWSRWSHCSEKMKQTRAPRERTRVCGRAFLAARIPSAEDPCHGRRADIHRALCGESAEPWTAPRRVDGWWTQTKGTAAPSSYSNRLDDKLADDKLADDKLADDKLADDKLADDELADDKLADDQDVSD